MDFTFTAEQKLLQENVERFIANEYTFDKRRAWTQSETGFSRENWAKFGELGWLCVGVAEEPLVAVLWSNPTSRAPCSEPPYSITAARRNRSRSYCRLSPPVNR